MLAEMGPNILNQSQQQTRAQMLILIPEIQVKFHARYMYVDYTTYNR